MITDPSLRIPEMRKAPAYLGCGMAADRAYCRINISEHRSGIQVGIGFDRRRHRATLVMADDHNQAGAQMADRILDALQRQTIISVAGSPHDEEIADSLVKDDLRRHARIGT